MPGAPSISTALGPANRSPSRRSRTPISAVLPAMACVMPGPSSPADLGERSRVRRTLGKVRRPRRPRSGRTPRPRLRAMDARRALVRRPSARLAEGLVTHIERTPVDLDLAIAPVGGLRRGPPGRGVGDDRGAPRRRLPRQRLRRGHRRDVRRPGRGHASRRRRAQAGDGRRTPTCSAALGYDVVSIEAPGTLDGGDVLKHGGTVWVGMGGRTNRSGVDQLDVVPRAVRRARRHRAGREGAAPEVGRHRTARRHRGRLRRRWSTTPRSGRRSSPCPRSPARTSSCSGDDLVLMSSRRPDSRGLFEERGSATWSRSTSASSRSSRAA